MKIWIPENLKKIYPYAPAPGGATSASYTFGTDVGNVSGAGKVVYGTRLQVELQGAGNEYRSFQLAVALDKKGPVEIVVSDLKSREHARLSKMQIQVHRVGCVPLDGSLTPDPLFEESEAQLARKVPTSFRVTVRIPPHQPAGAYRGLIKVRSAEGAATIQFLLRVYGFSLPDTPSMGVNFWSFPQYYAQHYQCDAGSEKYWALVKAYARDLKAHGQGVISLLNIASTSPIKWIDWQMDAGGSLRFDFRLLDEWVRVHKAAGMHQGLELECSIQNTAFDILDLQKNRRVCRQHALGSEVSTRYWGQLFKALARHLREQGWMHRVMIKPSDEITEAFVPQWQAMARLAKASDAAFLTTEALGFGRTGLLGCCDVFAMHAWCGMDFVPQIRQAGAEAWWYFSCDCDNPNFFLKNDWIEMRAIPWLTWQHQLHGVLHWSYANWNRNPFEDVYCGQPFAAGDCFMVYPGSEGPITSVRWEIFREGAQDFEYLKLFHEGLRRLPKKRREPLAQQVAAVVKRVTGLVTYSRNYANYHAAQQRLGEAIEGFGPC